MPNAVFIPAELNDLSVDVALGTPAQGAVLYRGAAKWNALAAGGAGQVLTSGGINANPSWAPVSTDLSAAVVLAPNSVDRNLIQPTGDGFHALVTKNHSATLTGANPFEHRLSSGTVAAYIDPTGAVAGTAGFFGDPTAAVLGEITHYLGYTNQMTLTGQGTGFTGFGFFNETSGTQFGDIITMGGVNRAAPVNSQAQAAFQITCTGHLDNTGTLTDYQFNIADYNAAGTALFIEGGEANDQRIGVVTSTFDGQLTVQPRSAGRKILTLKAQSGQTAAQQEWQDATAAPQLAVLANGSDFSFLATAGTKLGQTGQKVGFLGAAPVVRQTLPAAATDPATTQTLANALRSLAITFGLAN
jgi:hypothetical protein